MHLLSVLVLLFAARLFVELYELALESFADCYLRKGLLARTNLDRLSVVGIYSLCKSTGSIGCAAFRSTADCEIIFNADSTFSSFWFFNFFRRCQSL